MSLSLVGMQDEFSWDDTSLCGPRIREDALLSILIKGVLERGMILP